jgi:hypothetical protein
VHIAFGEAIAILAGDGLLTQAFGTLAELGSRGGAAAAVLARRAGGRELLAGQAIDLTEAAPTDIVAVERLHAAKTGALFAAAAELGAIAAGAPAEVCASLGRYGMAIGIAFQHADDRDDAELVELAATAAARMRALCGEARDIARSLGPRGATLDAIAAWIAASEIGVATVVPCGAWLPWSCYSPVPAPARATIPIARARPIRRWRSPHRPMRRGSTPRRPTPNRRC